MNIKIYTSIQADMIGGRVINLLEKLSGRVLIDLVDSVQLFYKLISFKAGIEFKKYLVQCKNFDDYYNLVDSFTYSLYKKSKYLVAIKLYQKKDEIIEFLKIFTKIKPKLILEIGTYDGGTLFFLSKFAHPDATIITIDLPIIRQGAGYSPAKIPFYKAFKSKNQKIHFIRENSHTIAAITKVQKILKRKKIDVLFIDGDHTYKGVKKDYENFSPFVRKGGLIAFHDIVEHPNELKCEVDRFWNEIKENCEYREFISEKGKKWAGIGLIYKNT